MAIILKSATIKNYKSLGNVSLNFRDLTIIVGSISSGKSNILEALDSLSVMVNIGFSLPVDIVQRQLRVGTDEFTYKIALERKEQEEQEKASYELSITVITETEKPTISSETLTVNNKKIIEIKNGTGEVRDEVEGGTTVSYRSKSGKLALNAAGDFGNKPFTSEVADFIKKWEFYNIDPDVIRKKRWEIRIGNSNQIPEIPKLDFRGQAVPEILSYWYENDEVKFQEINDKLKELIGINFDVESDQQGDNLVQVIERDGCKIPLSSMSDGTLRLIAYFILLIDDKLPPFIGIEEPERNFHPGMLTGVASAIKELSKKTQVVITTHSSQLLDCFTLHEINSDVSLILLTKKDQVGTVAFAVDNLSKEREDLEEWMQEFGVGSAIYHSQLLQDILENENV